MNPSLRFLLLQIRNQDDVVRHQEVTCFARRLECDPGQIRVCNLIAGPPSRTDLRQSDVVLIGGSGHYSATGSYIWLDDALNAMRDLYEHRIPTFASCWGFQAMARALGGVVRHDLQHAELGTHPVQLTTAGQQDPLFGELPKRFPALMGHEDRVLELPPGALLLASSDRVEQQAFCFTDRPLYCTQFHPELDRSSFLDRVSAYPIYVERIAGVTIEEFRQQCHETPVANQLLRRFVELFFGS